MDPQPLGARGTDGLKSARNLLLPRPLNQAEARLGKKSQGAKTLLTQRAGRNSQSGRLVYKSSKSKPVFRPPQSKHLQETVATEVSLQQMSASSLMMQLAKASLTNLKSQPKLTKQALKNIETFFALEYDDL